MLHISIQKQALPLKNGRASNNNGFDWVFSGSQNAECHAKEDMFDYFQNTAKIGMSEWLAYHDVNIDTLHQGEEIMNGSTSLDSDIAQCYNHGKKKRETTYLAYFC